MPFLEAHRLHFHNNGQHIGMCAAAEPQGGGWVRGSGGTPLLPRNISAAPKGLPKSDSLDCPRLPGLSWGRLIGRGSFGRVYKGVPQPI